MEIRILPIAGTASSAETRIGEENTMDEETRLVAPEDDLTSAVEAEIVPPAADELTRKIVAALDLLAAQIPDLQTPNPATARRVRGARTIPRAGVLAILAATEAEPRFGHPLAVDPQRACATSLPIVWQSFWHR